MGLESLLYIIVGLVVGALVGHYVGKNPQQAQALLQRAEEATAAEVAKLRSELATLLHHNSPQPTTPPASWSLGATYASITALSADITAVGFHQQINIDGVPTFNVGGPNPIDFYRVGGAVTQIHP